MSSRRERSRGRSFGLSVGSALTVLTLAFAWSGRQVSAEIAGAAGVILVVVGATRPRWLAWPSQIWWTLAAALGWLSSRMLLSLVFFVLLTPLRVMWRMSGYDPLGRRHRTFRGWSEYPKRYHDPTHFERMF